MTHNADIDARCGWSAYRLPHTAHGTCEGFLPHLAEGMRRLMDHQACLLLLTGRNDDLGMSAPKAEAAGLTMERREELRRVAEAATPGPWRSGRTTNGVVSYYAEPESIALRLTGLVDWMGPADAAHVAAFDPPTVLALLDALAAAEAKVEERVRALVLHLNADADYLVPKRHLGDRLRAALDTASSEGA